MSIQKLEEDMERLTSLHDVLQKLRPLVQAYCSPLLGVWYLDKLIEDVYNSMQDTQAKIMIEREMS